jgi:FKBP-type peptidyl-prolyl cis-trans isomerase FkpA
MKFFRNIFPCFGLLAALILLNSCEEDDGSDAIAQEQRYFDLYMGSNYPDAVPQESGLYYIINGEGTGSQAGADDWVLINHVSYTLPDDNVYDTYIERVASDNRMYDENAMYGPFKMHNGTLNDGFTEGLSQMHEGGSGTILFTSDLGYGSVNTGSVGANRSLKYEIELLEVLGPDIEAYEEAKIMAYTDTIAGVDSIYNATMDTVMYFVIDEATDGAPVGIDSTIQIAYKGYLTDGRVFDESAEDAPLEFTVGDEAGVIEGWNLGMQRFKLGEKGRLIIPFALAYGEQGKSTDKGHVSIPAYETLVFDVEVISVNSDDDSDDTVKE